MGATSPPGAGAAAGTFASQPQAGAAFTQLGAATPQDGAAQLGAAFEQPLPQLLLQPLPQPLLQLLQLWQEKRRSSRQGRLHLLQPLPQPLLHASAPQEGAAAQVGAAAAQVGAAFTQLGAATPQDGAAQLGAAFEQPLPQP